MEIAKYPFDMIIHGDCLEEMKKLPENSVDSIVTDPPYELGFMGKSWDNTGIANNPLMWAECLRVLKPGGHLLAFSGTRTYHRMAVAIEDAGFEVRDMIEWIYGSGFPKSLNIGKAVDKLQGNEREVIGTSNGAGKLMEERPWNQNPEYDKNIPVTKGTSEWEGWGTALKPAHEPICMARKPLSEKTVAENVLKYGTGGINIDENRVGFDAENENFGKEVRDYGEKAGGQWQKGKQERSVPPTTGRFPANLIHDNSEEVRECFPDANHKTGGAFANKGDLYGQKNNPSGYTDSGNASRFFKSIIYQAKASKSERNKGCEGLEEKDTKRYGDFEGTPEHAPKLNVKNTNNHPTVKPIALMEYLIKMVTPKGGTVLDPFMGSGSTGVAAQQNGYEFIGIEMEEEYIAIAHARMDSKELATLF